MDGGRAGGAFHQDSSAQARKSRGDTGVQVTRMGNVELRKLADHRRSPKGAQMVGDARSCLLIGETDTVGGDLTGHPGQGLDAHGYAWIDSAPAATVLASGPRRVGATSTAVTLYSGQLVAQSEYSVVITLAPLPGKWNVV